MVGLGQSPSAWGRQPEVRQQRRRWKKWVQSLGLPGTSRLTVIQTLYPLVFQFSVPKPGQTVISYFSVVPQGTVISPKFCGKDEWVGLYTDPAAVRADTAWSACGIRDQQRVRDRGGLWKWDVFGACCCCWVTHYRAQGCACQA